MSDNNGLVSLPSGNDVTETARRFIAAAQQAGLRIFADIDHERNAVDIGLPLRPTRLLLFGNPRGGTPLMQIKQTAGIDLPFKVLIWQDEEGFTWLTYNDPRWLADRHQLDQRAHSTVEAIIAGISKLSAFATLHESS